MPRRTSTSGLRQRGGVYAAERIASSGVTHVLLSHYHCDHCSDAGH
ncbi:MAG: MBL fold metallo-hydrolase [Flavonifractor plautii]